MIETWRVGRVAGGQATKAAHPHWHQRSGDPRHGTKGQNDSCIRRRHRTARGIGWGDRAVNAAAMLGRVDSLAEAMLAADTPIILTNPRLPDNPIIAANRAFCALSGYPPEQLLGRNCRFMQGRDTDPQAVAQLRAAIAAAEPIEVVLSNCRRDGTPFWNRLLVAPVFSRHGDLIYFFANQRDVTIEHQRVARLQGRADVLAAAEDRRRESHRAAGVAVWDWRPDSGRIDWSDGYQGVVGNTADGRPPSDVDQWIARLHAEDRAQARVGAAAIAAAGGRFEARMERDGQWRWLEAIGRVIARDPAGKPMRVTGIVLDVTERKAAEARAAANEARFRAMAEATPTIVFVCDEHGRNTYVSPQFPAFTGRTAADLMGLGWLESIAPADRERVRAASRDAIASGQQHESEFRVLRHDGSARWMLGRSVPIRQDGAALDGWCGTLTEIQAQVEARDALARSRVELEQLVADRTMALTEALEALRFEATERARVEDTLRHVQKMEAIGQLTGGMAHDFNNLLTAISGSLELLHLRLRQGRGAEAARYIEAARRAVDRGAGLIQRLLAFARRQTLDAKPVQPDRLVWDMIDLIRRTVGAHIEVVINLGAPRAASLCDANQLESAVLNLAINARDAMPDGGILRLSTSLRRLGPGGLPAAPGAELVPFIEVAVADTGTGMTAEVRSRAFDPFFTTKPVGQGTGLGLSQTYGFVHQSGGLVELDSEAGVGTTIRLLLPQHQDPDSVDPPDPKPAAALGPQGIRVLVVEDEATLRELLMESLEELGCDVTTAADGPAGLEIVRSATPLDLLVTDVGLPGLNGRLLAQAAREARPSLPILFITGYAGEALDGPVGGALPPGMEVISKPFTLAELARRLSQMVGQRDG